MTSKEKRIVIILLLLVLLLGAVSILVSIINRPSGPDVSVSGTCVPQSIVCATDPGWADAFGGSIIGMGAVCNDSGTGIGTQTAYDACARQITAADGTSCSSLGLTRFSRGEGSQGAFVGCRGTQNVFCAEPGVTYCQTKVSGTSFVCDTTSSPGCTCGVDPRSPAPGNLRTVVDNGSDSCARARTFPPGGGVTPPPVTPPVTPPPVTPPAGDVCGICGDGTRNLCCPGGSKAGTCSDADYVAGFYACNQTTNPPPPPPPPPPPAPKCGEYCNESAGIVCNTTGTAPNAAVRCVNNKCVNINCTGGSTTIPGRICDCTASATCAQRCGSGFPLCGPGYTCTYVGRNQCDTRITNGVARCVPIVNTPSRTGVIPNSQLYNGSAFYRYACEGGANNPAGNKYIHHVSFPNGASVPVNIIQQYICTPGAEPICGDALCNASTASGGVEECELTAAGSGVYKACTGTTGAAPTGATVNCNPNTCKPVAAPKYKCNTTNNACEVATDGTYDSEASCNEGTLCGTNSFDCVSNSCVQRTGSGGQYSTSASCLSACQPQAYCGNATCQSSEICERDGAGNFRACTASNITAGSAPSGSIVTSCRGMTSATGTTPATGSNQCTYCGDGIIQSGGGEQCDGGANCSASCTILPYCGDTVCQTGERCEIFNPSAPTVFGACSTVGQAPIAPAIAECRGITTGASSQAANACQYCGDGMTNGPEACDPTDTSDSDTIAGQCAPNCTVVPIQCIGLEENGPDPVDSSAGTFVEYTLTYQNIAATNPYPNIRLRVGPNGGEVGRNALSTASDLVAPYQTTRSASGTQWVYKFRWEALEVGGGTISSATYDVRAMLDGTNATAVTSPAQCLETMTINATAVTEPLFTIIKTGAEVCQSNGNSQINYTLTLRNIGQATGTPDFVTDTLDSGIVSAGIAPASISNGGSYTGGVITWDNTDIGAVVAGGSVSLTYSITVPANQIVTFSNEGVDNTALVQYDTSTTDDNTDSFSVNTPMDCTPPEPPVVVTPITGISDSGARYILLGIVFMLLGLLAFKKGVGSQRMQDLLQIAYMRSPFGYYEDKVDMNVGRKAKDKE